MPRGTQGAGRRLQLDSPVNAFSSLLALGLAVTSEAQVADDVVHTGTFVTTLGNETVAVESYSRSSAKLEGDIVLRVPGTTRYHYKLTFAKDGSVRASEFVIKPLGVLSVDEPRRLSLEFGGESVRLVSIIRGEPQTVTRPSTPSPNVVFLGGYASSFGLYGSLGMYEHLLTRVPVSSASPARMEAVAADTGKATTRLIRRPSPTEADIDFFKMAWMRVKLDEAGQILSADSTATTERTMTKRVEFTDIERFEKEFLALDKAGRGLGEASPNQEMKASVFGTTVVVKYGSPRLRGRSGVLTSLIASGRVWRTGANEATVIEIGRDLTIGGQRVPKGKYSLWSQTTAGGTELILNKETGQWGTSHKAAQDFVRIPVQTTKLDTPAENFTFSVATGEGGSELRIEWDTFRWSVPLTPAS
jgi:hypothetical protein